MSSEGAEGPERAVAPPATDEHQIVQFYEDDESLCDAVAQFLAAGLTVGEPVVVFATASHRQSFRRRWEAAAIDVERACDSGQLTLLDAAETLSAFMVDGMPDAQRFRGAVGGVLERVKGRARLFGEMVDLLWRGRTSEAALQLESLWNELGAAHLVLPAEGHVITNSDEDQRREIGRLRRRAQGLELALERRKQIELELRESRQELKDFIEAERHARSRAERAQKRTAKLHSITAALSRTLGAEEAVRIVIRETLPIMDASAGGVLLLDAAGSAIDRLIIDGDNDPHAVAEARRLQLDEKMPIVEALLTGQAVWVAGEAEIARRYPRLVELRERSRAQAWGAIPLVFEGRTIGSLGFRCDQPRQLGTEDEQFLLAVGQQCAQAIERARLYDEIRSARAAAEGANQAKDEFLAMLGHELRNPLSPIVTALQLMKLRGDRRATRERDVIERQVSHLVRLVDDLLDISKITRGKVQLDRRPVELSAIVAQAMEIASPLFEQRGHHVNLSVPRGGMWMDGDETRLAQVIANLLTNAAKYTEPGGSISLRAWRDGHEIVIRVKDNGVGIPPELLPRMFDLFVQGYRASDRGQGGLGIGLALVRNLVALHRGSVVALSDGEGKGSEFVVRLPAIEHADAPEPAAEPERGPRTRCAHPQRVLVVDDNEDAAELLALMLEAVGHKVAVANDGPQALALIEQFAPEVAVLDIGLPVMDGYELAGKLRERLSHAPPRLMAVTGYGQDHDRARSQQAGFELHFVKPLSPDKLLAAIDAPVGQK